MKRLLFVILLIVIAQMSNAQFYNGLQMDFGKNRVQYEEYDWSLMRFDRYDTYYYLNGKNTAIYVGRIADEAIREIERFFEYQLDSRILFIIYNTQSDFKQSNIGYVTGLDQNNIGGVTQIINNKVILYNTGNHDELVTQVRAGIAQILMNEMIYGTNLTSQIASNTLINLPEWFVKGLLSYVSREWSVEIDDEVKDGILSGRYENFNHLTGDDASYVGHAFWNYVAITYGGSQISNIVYVSRMSKSVDNGFSFVLGHRMSFLTQEMLMFYKERYESVHDRAPPPQSNIKKRWKNPMIAYQQLKISHDGTKYAFVSNNRGKIKIWLYDKTTDKLKKLFRKGQKLEQITDYSYPVLAWHPDGQYLTFVMERRGKVWFYMYNTETGETTLREWFYYDKVLSMNFSPDGLYIAVSGVRDGMTDIYIHPLLANVGSPVTHDIYDDINPHFIEDGGKIVFSSNRKSDTIWYERQADDIDPEKLDEDFDLFIYNRKNESNILTRLTDTRFANETIAYERKNNNFLCLSDENGIQNLWEIVFDSVISHIDTVIHYRYFSMKNPVSDFSRNIGSFDYNNAENIIGGIYLTDMHQHLFFRSLDSIMHSKGDISGTVYMNRYIKGILKDDSLEIVKETIMLEQQRILDSLATISPDYVKIEGVIDIDSYEFEIEKENLPGQQEIIDQISGDKKHDPDGERLALPWPEGYETHFYPDYMVTQIDFSYLNTSYQKFTGGPVIFSPGLNAFIKLGALDLFENYRVTTGFKITSGLDNYEYLLSYENVEKRWDKQYVYYRRKFIELFYDNSSYGGEELHKMITQELKAIHKYPFNQVQSIRFTTGLRYDSDIAMSDRYKTLNKLTVRDVWFNFKAEFIFDNTINTGVNLYNGTRFKIFGEYYQKAMTFDTAVYDVINDNMIVIGADFRHYQKIHREMILATRVAASSSYGNHRLIYYLGSIDNWIKLSANQELFDYSIPIDQDFNYAFQTLATNMRGFSQNIRNGNSFAVINSELRWPIIKYFSSMPLNSDFVNTLQIVFFGDVGTAWSKESPWSGDNAWNINTIEQPPVLVTLIRDKSALVWGYGFGLRARLLGYFIRVDWAWGVEGNVLLPPIFYLSLNLDF